MPPGAEPSFQLDEQPHGRFRELQSLTLRLLAS